MYAKIENNNVVKYPVSEQEIRDMFPNVSFSQPLFPLHPYVVVNDVEKPDITSAQRIEEGQPVLINGQWYKSWNVVDLSVENYQLVVEEKRNIKLGDLANIRWEYQQRGLNYNGNIFKTDEASRLQYSLASQNLTVLSWKIANGNFITLNEQEIQELNIRVWDFIQRSFNIEKTVTDLIMSCRTIEDLDSININSYFV